jgi:tetratricopeptide (TPR) repeat protein
VLLSGCKTTFKSKWTNFNAYYNTYYNAKESYEAGLEKNLNQQRDYNPLQPIRIHHKPLNAGSQDFEKAIQKGADVLRRYDDSKWVDNAVGLIGKSYYFRQEYFSADQKFKELFVTTKDVDLQQESIIWQGRVLLEMELHNEGVAFLSEQLSLQSEIWSKSRRAEAKALLAQHHVQLENWQIAATELSEALPELKQKEYRERGYFLLGQIYERIGNTEAAFEAYDQVSDHYVEYRVQYLAQRKKAEVARELGRNEVAYRIFNDMVRDDKNLDYKSELDFELARTQHERGEFKRAERSYNNVLRNKFSKPSAEIAARSYNGLAEIYRFQYNDFTKAAAYYDSAAQRKVPDERLPEEFNAGELAESFGSYARIKKDIALQDSLLRLGQMNKQEFDSVITQLRQKKLEELEKLREQQKNQQNQLVNVNKNEENTQEATNMTNGFLNANNPVMQQNARQQFFAIWGDRPLADNWRVRDLIDLSSISQDSAALNGGDTGNQPEMLQVQIDLSRIPFTKNEQDSVKKKIAAAQYELGNLFFLSLNMPDSAIHYFNNAIENPSSENVNMVSLYSLSELYSSQDDKNEAVKYAYRLIEQYPNSVYATRVSEAFGLEKPQQEMESKDIMERYRAIITSDSVSTAVKADSLKSMSLENINHKIAPRALFESIQAYTQDGKKYDLYNSKVDDWINKRYRWEERKSNLQTIKDSARTVLNDTTATLTDVERDSLQALVDSTLKQPDFSEDFPYIGASWDSARAAVDTFLVVFKKSDLKPRIDRLEQELAIPVKEKEPVEVEETQDLPQEPPSGNTENNEYVKCAEVEEGLEIRGGMDAFMQYIDLPEDIRNEQVTYLFRVNQRGILDEFVLQTDNVPEEITSAFETAFEEEISFEPMLINGQAEKVECALSFPLRN